MDPLQQLLAERACERLILDFVHRLDLGEPASVAELFTQDGRWEWPPPGDGRRSEGRGADGPGHRRRHPQTQTIETIEHLSENAVAKHPPYSNEHIERPVLTPKQVRNTPNA